MRNPGLKPRSPAATAAAFGRDAGGNVATVFAMLFIPIAILVFGSIELYRAEGVKTNLQDSLDAATLTVARTQTQDPTRIQAVGMAALQASLNRHTDVSLVTDPAQTYFRLLDGRIISRAATQVDPIIAGHFLPGGMRTVAESEVVRASSHVEVAMVLDVTGSMNQSSDGVSKIQRLRTAGLEMINTLEQAAVASGDPESVRVAVVPFSATVRLSSNASTLNTWRTSGHIVNATTNTLANQNMATPQGAPAQVNRFTLFNNMGLSWAGCVESRAVPFDVQDTPSNGLDPNTQFVPYFAPDEPDPENSYYTSGGSSTQLVNYNNYIDDEETGSWPATTVSNGQTRYFRAQNNVDKYDNSARLTGVNANTGYNIGPNAGCEITPIRRLTNDWGSLRSTISGLVAAGDTNIPMGLVWGWHALSPSAPFSDGTAYGTTGTRKVVVLMTDGNNTHTPNSNWNQSFYAGYGYIGQGRLQGANASSNAAQRTAAMDARLATLCTNMRNRGIQVYTIRVEVTTGSNATLRNCATDPATDFYEVSDAARLSDVFQTIAGQITQLRIAH